MANLISAVVDALKRAFGDDSPTLTGGAGFKALGDKWFAWWSNNFEDAEGEYFSEKAIDEYVRRVDVGAVPPPELWLWHTPGTRMGEAQWVGRIGHFAVAAGSFDATPAGTAAKAYFARGEGDNGMSHGFAYDPGQKSDGVYHQFNTFELSVLPREKAANPYTAFEEVYDMELTDEKRDYLARVLGSEELAAQLITATEERSKAMESLDVRYKDFVQMDAPAVEPVAEAAKDDTPSEPAPAADIGAFVTSITEDVAVLANAVTGLIGRLDTISAQAETEKARHEQAETALRAEVKALREEMDLRPRSATTDAATAVEPSALTDAIKAQIEQDDYETVLGLRVKKLAR